MSTAQIQQYYYWEAKKKFSLDFDLDSYWIAYIIEEGSCRYNIENKTGIAKSNDILICPPYVSFKRKIISPLTFHFFRFSLNKEINSKKLIGKNSLDDPRFAYNCSILKEIKYDNSKEMTSLKNHLLNDFLLLYFYENYSINIEKKIQNKDQIINSSIPLLSDLTVNAMSITDIALRLNISPSYFSKKFKKSMNGVTPIEYRTKMRVKEAQKLILETDYILAEIATLCGFKNEFYFSRVFTKYMGESPSSFRKNHKI